MFYVYSGDKIVARDAMVKSGIPVARGSDGPVSDPEEVGLSRPQRLATL